MGERYYARMCPNCTHKLSVHVLINPLTEASTGGGNRAGGKESRGGGEKRRREEEEEETLVHADHCTSCNHISYQSHIH